LESFAIVLFEGSARMSETRGRRGRSGRRDIMASKERTKTGS